MTKCLQLTTVRTSPQFAGLHTNHSCVAGWPGAACAKLFSESRICGQRCGSWNPMPQGAFYRAEELSDDVLTAIEGTF
jgi:hypothetical protein